MPNAHTPNFKEALGILSVSLSSRNSESARNVRDPGFRSHPGIPNPRGMSGIQGFVVIPEFRVREECPGSGVSLSSRNSESARNVRDPGFRSHPGIPSPRGMSGIRGFFVIPEFRVREECPGSRASHSPRRWPEPTLPDAHRHPQKSNIRHSSEIQDSYSPNAWG
jgi:hypothetical protein